jgi:hypothetical protein
MVAIQTGPGSSPVRAVEPCKNLQLVYSGNDTWDHMFQQGIRPRIPPASSAAATPRFIDPDFHTNNNAIYH